MLDGADHDEADETEDRWGAEGADRVGGAARAVDGDGAGAALRGPPEPDLRVEEAAAGARGAGVRSRDGNRGGGGPGARAREAARQDRRADRGARFFSAEVRKMSAPDRRGLLDRRPWQAVDPPAVRVVGRGALRRLPGAAAGQRQRSGGDAPARGAVHRPAVPGLAAAGGAAAGRRGRERPPARAAAEASGWARGAGAR